MHRIGQHLIALIALSGVSLAEESYFKAGSPDIQRYKVTPDVVFGKGKVIKDGKEATKDLWMDIYYPVEDSDEPRPAVVLAYGGAFHRGHPRIPYVGFDSQTTTMSQYAMRYAEEGFVCFTISYRVAPDNPIPSPYEGFEEDDLDTSLLEEKTSIDQANAIRRQMKLEELTEDNVADVMKGTIVSAAQDVRLAIRHIKESGEKYGIDPDRIALGGFSAGAVSSVNVAYGMQEEVAAVFINSGYPSVFDMNRLMKPDSKLPPILIFLAQNDYPVVFESLSPFLERLKALDVDHSLNWIPGYGHFYPSGVTSLSGKGDKMSVEQRTIRFLRKHLRKTP